MQADQNEAGIPSKLPVHFFGIKNILMRKFYLLAITVLITKVLTAQTPAIVKDIYNFQNNGSITGAANYTTVGATTFFTAGDGIHGFELWKTDCTAAGTVMVKDINPGEQGSQPVNLTNINGVLFFSAAGTYGTNTGYDTELWKSDGMAAGTVLVKDIYTGGLASNPASLTNVNGTLFFSATTNTSGRELWTDGTEAGTVLVKDIRPGTVPSVPADLVNFNGTLFFSANNGVNGQELWKSDGTDAGTTIFIEPVTGAGGSFPIGMTVVGNTMYFAMIDPSYSAELWKSDGTVAGTVLVKDIYAGGQGSSPRSFTPAGNTVFFTANDGINGIELWKTDGTAAGTALVKDTYPGATITTRQDMLTAVNGILFFSASDPVNGLELWKSDGTAAGTVGFDMQPGPNGSFPAAFAILNNSLIFSGTDPLYGTELWSIGTAAVVTNFTWTGSVSTAWDNPGNWGGNTVPTSTSAGIIPAGRPRYPVVSVTTAVKSVSCAPNTSVTINAGVVLNILR